MIDKICNQQVLGGVMHNPSIFSETEKYCLDLNDFSSIFERLLFKAIKGLYEQGAKTINILDIENFISSDSTAKAIFEKNNGIEYLQDIDDYAKEENFEYYYHKLKKLNLLRDLKRMGYNTNEFYCENLIDERASEINSKFEGLSEKDIIDEVKKKILGVEKEYIKNDVTETRMAIDGMEDLIESFEEVSGVGLAVQGHIYNQVVSGARRGALYIRSGSSGLGKSRQAVGDACYLAYPIRYNSKTASWESTGSCEKVLFIATEQDFPEIQRMILAYLTDINEDRFKYGHFNELEERIIKEGLWLMKQYKENFYIVRMPNPTIGLVKNIIRENCLTRDIGYVFYDYIFVGPSLLSEFKGFALRNDEVLLMFSTALKDMAVEQNVCVMTSTQVNANSDNNREIRNEATLAGGRSTINKADVGAIMARPTKEELETLSNITTSVGIPNMVTDIYKVRAGAWTQVRIWSYVNLGTLRKEDLFITDSQLRPIDNFFDNVRYDVVSWEDEDAARIRNDVKYLNERNKRGDRL